MLCRTIPAMECEMGVVVKYQRRSRSLEVSSSNEVGLHPSITHPSHSLERWNKDERK